MTSWSFGLSEPRISDQPRDLENVSLPMYPLRRFLSPFRVAASSSLSVRKVSTSLRPKILLLGDSLTQEGTDPDLDGWVTQLQHNYTRSADVVVRGLYGYSTEIFVKHALPGLKKELAVWAEPPAFVALWLGGNDSALLSGYEAALHVPIENYRANLEIIVKAVQEEAPDAAMLLITPPAVNDQARRDAWTDPEGQLDFSNDEVGKYARVCTEVAGDLNVPVLDFHTIMNELNEQERSTCQYDGLHFNQKGNKLVIDQLLATIEREFPTLAKRLDTWEHPDYFELLSANSLQENV